MTSVLALSVEIVDSSHGLVKPKTIGFVLNAKFTHFQLLHGQKTLYYNEMMMMFSLYYTNKLS
jgi:hypothetical protein